MSSDAIDATPSKMKFHTIFFILNWLNREKKMTLSCSSVYTPSRKYPYGKQKFDVFCQITLESKLLQKIYYLIGKP